MLSGLDGRKMSTSWGNVVTVVDKPNDMYGKLMSMKDELMPEYFELCTDIPLSEVERIKKDLKLKKLNPRDAKARLAREIMALYYGKKVAERAEKEFSRVFKKKELPTKIPGIKIKEGALNILDLLVKTKLTSSKSEAKRLVLQKAVKINQNTQTDWEKTVEVKKGTVVQIGKRRFRKLI